MKLLETTVISTEYEKRSRVTIYLFAGGVSSLIVSIIVYFKHGNQWGSPDHLSMGFLLGSLLLLVAGVIVLRLLGPVKRFTLTVAKEQEGLGFHLVGDFGEQHLCWPFEWEHWQSMKKLENEQELLVENVRIRHKDGSFLGFTETMLNDEVPNPAFAFREGRLGNHPSVFELNDVRGLVTILEQEAWEGFIPPLLPEGSTKVNWGDLIG